MAARSLSGPVVSMSGTLDRIRVGWNRAAIPSDPDPIYFKRGDDRGSVSCASKPAGGARPRGVSASALKRLPIWFGSMRRRSEEHTSELQSLMRISYAVFCLKKTNKNKHINLTNT